MHRHLRSFVVGNLVNLSVAVAGLILLGFGVVLGQQAWQSHRTINRIQYVNVTIDAIFVATDLQGRERGITAGLIGGRAYDGVPDELDSLRDQVDAAWRQVLAHISDIDTHLPPDSPVIERSQALHATIEEKQQLRNRVDAHLQGRGDPVSLDEWFELTTEVNSRAANLRLELMLSDTVLAETARLNLLIRENGIRVAEYTGQVRGLLNFHVANSESMPPDQIEMARWTCQMAAEYFSELVEAAGTVTELSEPIAQLKTHYAELRDIVDRMLEEAIQGEYHLTEQQWWEITTSQINQVFTLLSVTSELAIAPLREQARRQSLALVFYLVLAMVAMLLASLSLRRVHRNAESVFLQKEMSEKILDSIADAVIAVDANGRIIHLNPIAEDLTGWAFHEAAYRPYIDIFRIYNKLHTSLNDPIGTCLEQNMSIVLSEGHVLIDRNGHEIPIDDSCAPIRNRHRKIVGAVVVFSSRQQDRQANRILTYHATRDSLTNTFNRREFEHQLHDLRRHARDTGEHHTLVFIDLDHFKVVNDMAGHAAGDQMLRQIAWLTSQCIRDTDTLARLGGDEFGLLLKRCPVDQGRKVAAKIQKAIREYRFPWEGQAFQVGSCFGLVEITPDSPDCNELIREADAACHTAKERGRNHIQVYTSDDMDLALKQGRMRWITRLTEALDEDRFELFGQVIHPLKPDLPIHLEILLRLRERDGTLVSPGAFIPAAERHGIMPDIDQWVVEHACQQMGPLMAKHPGVIFCINLSATTMLDPDNIDELADIIAEHEIRPECLLFEITETAVVSSLDTTIAIMKRLKKRGIRFALDDFGTGLSSLTSLKTLPIDHVKIDGAFIRNLPDDPVALAMVEAIARIATLLNIGTTAEFVENAITRDQLKTTGIDHAQGFYFGKPQPLRSCLDEGIVN
jgi:diguanylate cyclase (GGDEF)-like protein/PAS domain S-box-containing protein